MTPKDVGTWITILTMGAAGVARFVALEEAKTNAVNALADHEARLRAQETSRERDKELSELRVQVTELKGEVRALRVELMGDRDRRRGR